MATSIVTLISYLATWGAGVAQVKNSYDLTTIPDKIGRVMLPCLIPVPEVGGEQGFKTCSFIGNSPEVDITINHLLLNGEASDPGVKKDLPPLMAMLDAYLAAAKANPTLVAGSNPAFNVIMQFSIEVGLTAYAEIEYHSISFEHKYKLYI